MKKRLEAVPEFRRGIAKERIERLIERSYQEGEQPERIETLVNLVLDALEIDEYWMVCNTIEKTDKADVIQFASALDAFGLADMAFMVEQANRRLKFLDGLFEMATNCKTLEKDMHKALENNLWVFGAQYGLMASNQQLKSIVEKFVGEIYNETDADNRPDLLLSSSMDSKRLLIEFKRPSLNVGRDAEAQAKKYADKLTRELQTEMDVFVIGGQVDPSLRDEYASKNLRFLSYKGVITQAQDQLRWLIRDLCSRIPTFVKG